MNEIDRMLKETNSVFEDMDHMIKEMNDEMSASMAELRNQTDQVIKEVQRMKQALTWGAWEPYTVTLIPRRVNGRWYFKGDVIYRRQRFGPGGTFYAYGDQFDVLKEQYND